MEDKILKVYECVYRLMRIEIEVREVLSLSIDLSIDWFLQYKETYKLQVC